MIRIERDLEVVVKTRALHRASRRDVPYPIVALVGYTNAGKSTLFNRLTRAEVVAADMLFATLDPTLRALSLPHGGKAMLSDTVGFISSLPTQLVAAFRATLEEVLAADVILHVRDISHEDSEAQGRDVEAILGEIGVAAGAERVIEVWNKLDRLDPERRQAALGDDGAGVEGSLAVSALTGEGTDRLLEAIEARLAQGRSCLAIELEGADGQGLHWLYENTEVMARESSDDGRIRLKVRVAPEKVARVTQRFGAVAAAS